VSGELTLATEAEFTTRVAQALAGSRGPVLFDVSGLDFADCSGARALARAVLAVPSPGTGLCGCNTEVRRVLEALGLELPHRPGPGGPPAARRPRARAATLSRSDSMAAMTHAARANTRQTALYASEVMSRLAATYSELALNSRYRVQRKSEDRGRLLALSGRAHDLSRQYLHHAVENAGTWDVRGRPRDSGPALTTVPPGA
jgi:anti-anti-sigma factor